MTHLFDILLHPLIKIPSALEAKVKIGDQNINLR